MKVCIIGGGAAGMMAAVSASKSKDNQVIIFEKNEKLGKKLFITGKGRCNLTNNCDILDFYKNIITNEKFMYSSFDRFNNKDLMDFFFDNELSLKVERGDRVFPTSDKSYDVTDCLKRVMKKQGVTIKLLKEVKNIDVIDKHIKVRDVNNGDIENISYDKLIIATGGISYKQTGSTGDGYIFAKDMGINVIDTTPSLVPLEVKESTECKEMMGLTLKNVSINVKVYDGDNKKKVIYTDFGELLFTHFGLSGPIVLSASCYMKDEIIKDKNVVISIDLKPTLTNDQLDKRLLREIEENPIKNVASLIKTLLPSSMVEIFLKRLSDNYDFNIDKKNTELTKEDRRHIIELLKDYRYIFTKKRGYDEAIITQGGVDVKDIDPKTMRSKKIDDVYYAGEVLDIDCMTGGFNLQIAWTTGYVAGLCQ